MNVGKGNGVLLHVARPLRSMVNLFMAVLSETSVLYTIVEFGAAFVCQEVRVCKVTTKIEVAYLRVLQIHERGGSNGRLFQGAFAIFSLAGACGCRLASQPLSWPRTAVASMRHVSLRCCSGVTL